MWAIEFKKYYFLQRLPEELLPAIEKFLFISRDDIENVSKVKCWLYFYEKVRFKIQGKAETERINEITLLVKCLIIICRHFDNIETIYNLSYIGNCIGVCNHLIQRVSI